MNEIIQALLEIVYLFVSTITYPLLLLNDVVLPSAISSSLTTASSYLSPFNDFIPISTILEILALLLSFEIAYFTYKGIMWVIKKIPLIN